MPNHFINYLFRRLPSAGHTTMNCTLALLTCLLKDKIESLLIECTSLVMVQSSHVELKMATQAAFTCALGCLALFLEQPLLVGNWKQLHKELLGIQISNNYMCFALHTGQLTSFPCLPKPGNENTWDSCESKSWLQICPPTLVSHLGCLHHSVCGPGGNLETLGEQLEVVDERLHGILHRDKEQ